MFYCEGCRVENGWPGVVTTSFGRCEMCKEFEPCFDFPSYMLLDKKPEKQDDWNTMFKDIT